ncbi:hypothetical protein SAMD00019534_015420 [Acytostelium subglobosum LB1]|uniref:hypothetical protein n=1 Tax=Acytostelium subglobosum LB1 TaxID=1410327 RepID=UPI000645013D|nr:hypothetical protein SAMD00019534_015420 [Acytostelium subglobosum LB1]GAM18367.1 hypothetical protein SAMD00019534_015420 [Acytostelium subglobosum LB1]|eukprot:XP_012757587.1 hypothetical protein SAMD00019534_015420 [Acytostelium subglobosum LB1]
MYRYTTICLLLLTTLALVSATSIKSNTNTCRAITFSGAGDRGAYEVGVAAGLVSIRTPEESRWQVATGISAGAINTAGMAMYSVGQEQAATKFLVDTWLATTRDQIWKNWAGGPTEGFLFQQGLLDDAPLLTFLNGLFNQTEVDASNRTILVGATSYDTGLFVKFSDMLDPDIVLMVKASASIPGLFEPTNIRGELFMDGGATYATPVTDTAELCAQTGAENTIIDAIIVGKPIKAENNTAWKTPSLMMRAADIVKHNMFMKDIETAFQAYPNILINLYYPSQPLPGDFLGFQYSQEMITIGLKDATSESPSMVTVHSGNYKEVIATLI